MSAKLTNSDLLRQAVMKVASLPEEDLLFIVEFADYPEERRQAQTERKRSIAAVRRK